MDATWRCADEYDRDDGHEARAAEVRQRVRQHDLVVICCKLRFADADDGAAEDAQLKRQYAAAGAIVLFDRRRDRAVREDLPADLQHGVARRAADEEGDHGRKRRDLLLRLRHADGDADGKDDRQVAEDRAARVAMMERSA